MLEFPLKKSLNKIKTLFIKIKKEFSESVKSKIEAIMLNGTKKKVSFNLKFFIKIKIAGFLVKKLLQNSHLYQNPLVTTLGQMLLLRNYIKEV